MLSSTDRMMSRIGGRIFRTRSVIRQSGGHDNVYNSSHVSCHQSLSIASLPSLDGIRTFICHGLMNTLL